MSNSERDMLADAALHVDPGVLVDQATFATFGRTVWDSLEVRTRAHIDEFAAGLSVRPVLYIDNLPVDPMLPPTPYGEHNRSLNRQLR